MSEPGAGLPALILFTDAVKAKFRGMRYAIEDRWERAMAKKAVKALGYVVKPGDNLLDIAEKCVSERTSLPPLPPLCGHFNQSVPHHETQRMTHTPLAVFVSQPLFHTHAHPPFKNFPVIA